MNNIRRKSVKEALNLIEKAREILEEVKDEEQEAYDNLPESLQCGERGEQMQENIDNIDDIEKWNDIEELKKANPNMGVSVKESFFEDEIAVAESSPSKKAEFLTKYCNIKQNSSIAWLDYAVVDGASVEKTLEDFRDCYAVGGIDLSQTTDLTAASVVIEKDGILYAFTQFFMPKNRMEKLQATDGVPYDIWKQAQGC